MRKALLLLVLVLAVMGGGVAGAQDVTCEAGFRAYEHVNGTDCIPEQPQRVFVYDVAMMEMLVLLNRQPVARSVLIDDFMVNVFPDLAEPLTALTGDLPDVGFPVSAEVLLEARPDVIVTNSYFAASFGEGVDAVAPLIVIESEYEIGWQEKLRRFADVIGATEEFEAFVADYDARVAALQDALPNRADITVSIVASQEQLQIDLANAFSSQIVADVGLARPPSQALTEEEAIAEYGSADYTLISNERVDLLEADYLFFYVATPTEESRAQYQGLLDEVLADPLFNTLPVVQAGNVVQVGGYWYGQGFYSAHGVIDDLFRYVAGIEPTIPNPLLPTEPTADATVVATVEAE